MANVLESLRERFFPKDNYDDEYYDDNMQDEYDDYEEEPVPPRTQTRRYSTGRYGTSSKVFTAKVSMEVVVCTPTSIDEIGEACEALKSNKTVVVNLEKVNLETAQRISDFLSGASFALDGKIQPISNEILIIGPTEVDITGDFAEELQANGINIPKTSSSRWK